MTQIIALHDKQTPAQSISAKPILPLRAFHHRRYGREGTNRVGDCVLFRGVNLHGVHEQVLALAIHEYSCTLLYNMVYISFFELATGISAWLPRSSAGP